MSRPWVLDKVAAIIEAEPSSGDGKTRAFTYRYLAEAVYGVRDPTEAQVSAARRAIGRLVAEGRAERVGPLGTGEHLHARAGRA